MSLQKISLGKLLKIIFLPPAKQIFALREDIRRDAYKESGIDSSGGDFYGPFWSDAKLHVAGISDLTEHTAARIENNWRRKRLYPPLRDNFLKWWAEQRRRWNEPIVLQPKGPHSRLILHEVGVAIKVENVLTLEIGDHTKRLVYPYFAEEPVLADEGTRIGLWILNEALKEHAITELHILDVFRGASFSVSETPLKGNEKARLIQFLKELIALRKKLQKK